MVIYPVVHEPVMFDLMREVETGAETFATVEMLAAAEKLECECLLVDLSGKSGRSVALKSTPVRRSINCSGIV